MSATIGIPPAITEETATFWNAAKDGRLLVQKCDSCDAESFPPRLMCRTCRSRTTHLIEVTAAGYIYSYTVNHQRWLPGLEVPFVLVLVQFDAHPGVRIFGRLRGCPPEAVAIGMPVQVGFEPGPGGCVIPSFIAQGETLP